ncbi:MAG: M24 family metallopeptidase [bacterium]
MLTRETLKADLDRRITAAHALMKAKDLKLLIAVCFGAPHHNGWIRYFTSAEVWGGRLFLLIRPETSTRHVVMRSTYDAEWVRQQALDTTVDSTLIEQISPMERTIELVAAATGGRGRVGMLRKHALTPSEYHGFQKAFPDLDVQDVTDEFNQIRQIKSAFEIEAIRDTGRILATGMDLFARIARPGRLALEIAGEVDGYLKGQGCFWGRVKYSLDQRPYTVFAPPDRRLAHDDVILFQFVHSGPLGYWYELARVHSFMDLPADTKRRLETMDAAIREAAKVAVPRGTYREFSETADRVFRDSGFKVIGKHTFDCHAIGTDETEGPSPPPADWQFKENMVLGVHPATLLEGGYGFLLCENFLVRSGGAIALSPMPSFYQRLEAT